MLIDLGSRAPGAARWIPGMEPERTDVGFPDDGDTDSDYYHRDNEDDDPDEGGLTSPSTSTRRSVSAVTILPDTVMASALNPTTPVTFAVTVAVPSASAVIATPAESVPKWHHVTEVVQQKPQIDDSRRLFQRLWTDEDEIGLLRGFLEYTTSHRGGSSHPPDTGPFYDQIKSKLQLDFNRNQLMEKLRRLKKKYRNVMCKIGAGKEVFFKNPHDQATFEISRMIWSHTGKIIGFEDNSLDVEETSNNHHVSNTHTNNLNFSPTANACNFEAEVENGVEKKVMITSNSGSKKRSRSKLGKVEEERPFPSNGFAANVTIDNFNNKNEHVDGGNVAGIIEETVRSCFSPVIKEMLNGTASMVMNSMGGSPCGGARGACGWSPMAMAMPQNLNFEGMTGQRAGRASEKVLDEKWRKQQILELEVYSRRLELVQDQIRVALNELRSMPGGGG